MGTCTQCGAETSDSDKSCPECGHPSPDATAAFEPIGTDEGDAAPVAEALEGPVLVVRKGPQPGERFYLDRGKLSIGRDPASDIFLNDMTVSRTHALLEVEGSAVTVTDAGSLNGTYLNGICVDSGALHEGDVLQVGTFQMVYHGGEDGR